MILHADSGDIRSQTDTSEIPERVTCQRGGVTRRADLRV